MDKKDFVAQLIVDQVKKEILEWAREPCKDGKEKCPECVTDLLKRFDEESTLLTGVQDGRR